MTLQVFIGRRVPRGWVRRQTNRISTALAGQEHIWQMIKMSMSKAKKRANASGKITWVMTYDKEMEDLHYQLEWMRIIIKGDRPAEEDEYQDALKLYDPLGQILKKEFKVTDEAKKTLGKQFKTKMLESKKVQQAYKKGAGAASDSNISNKLLELGIMTHIEWIQDFKIRKEEI